jgi:TolB-like protein
MVEQPKTDALTLPFSFGRYQLTRRLGRGGMGVVYAAHDERLDREVAIKLIASLGDDAAISRFWREARAAASVSHPHVCQIYEIDEGPHGIYLAMELLDGESLEQRLLRGACPVPEAATHASQLLDALQALHDRGLVHRDVKPSNLFLTPHGAKLLDFGLARSIGGETVAMDGPAQSALTQPGMIIGTPKYMAPEQVGGDAVDARADLFSAGCVLFEMLAGQPPFNGNNVIDLLFAILNEQPPALQGSDVVVAVDRVIRRALAKRPIDRFRSASEMATALRDVDLSRADGGGAQPVRALRRLVVPPLRLQGVGADAEYLSFGLAEAMSGSLASFGGVVVRSPAVATRWQTEGADPRQLAAEADVVLVLLGSLLRSGPQVRASIQLVDAPSGTVLGATSVKGAMDDIFALEERMTEAVTGLLGAHIGMRPAPVGRTDVPANAVAFEQYLRGLELSRTLATADEARQCLERAVEHDPAFAPAWAWLGRAYRIIGKYAGDRGVNDERGERALRRALALNPDLPVAHRFLTYVETERGQAEDAMSRLLQHARVNRHDAHLFAGLINACRYAGLAEASFAAWREARRLDPTLMTGAVWTLSFGPPLLAATIPMELEKEDPGAYFIYLVLQGRGDEARRLFTSHELEAFPIAYRETIRSAMRVVTHDAESVRAAVEPMLDFHVDPEAIAIAATLATVGNDLDFAEELWARVVRAGFTPAGLLAHSPVFAPLRERPGFAGVLAEARVRQRIAASMFTRSGGPELLGVAPVLD